MKNLEKKYQSILEEHKKEISLSTKYPEQYDIAAYFRKIITKRGYILSITNWHKTLTFAREIAIRHKDISVEDWLACIDWCFSNEKQSDKFWSKVQVNHLGTVINMFNAYKQSNVKRGVEENGRKRFNKY